MAEQTNPKAAAAVNRLRRWAVDPAGGGKVFQWGTPGDFGRCTAFYKGKIPGHMIDGWCANLHRLATGGFMPGHAPSEGGDAAKPHKGKRG